MSKKSVVGSKALELLGEKEELEEQLRDVEKKLQKVNVDPHTFVGRYFRSEMWNNRAKYTKVLAMDRNGFNLIVVSNTTNPLKAGDDDTFPTISFERQSLGSFLDYDTEKIDAGEFEAAYRAVMDLIRL